MKESFFRSMTWLHTWVGLLVCWLLFLIYYSGTISFFRDEVTLWSQPEAHQITHQSERVAMQPTQIIAAIKNLQNTAPNSPQWRISLPDARNALLSYGYAKPREEGQRRAPFETTYLDPNTNQITDVPRETKGGNFFYRLHFDLHYIDVGTARWLVCLASLFMLIALISGVVIHKRIFKDMFSFRRNKGSRSWLDGHNISSVLALPFHIMITYTGLITLIFMLFPYPANTMYEKGLSGLFNDAFPTSIRPEPSTKSAPLININTILDQVYTKAPNADLTRLTIRDANKKSATVAVYLSNKNSVQDASPVLLFNAVNAELLSTSGMNLSGSQVFYDSMTALHTGRLAKPLLRWLYFLCGIAGCAMIATGCVMWAKRLRERMKNKSPSFGLKLVEGLNLATLMGLPLATCAFFIANRLLPLTMTERADKEILVFFLTWLGVSLFALFKRAKRQWLFFARLNALACISVPIVNALTTNGNIVSYLVNNQWALFSFDLLCLVFGALFIIQAKKLRTQHPIKKTSNSRHRDKKATQQEQET
ncbi:MAG: PepSY-associated TM helix domain-containing protein [Pseudoalteromonas sp.]